MKPILVRELVAGEEFVTIHFDAVLCVGVFRVVNVAEYVHGETCSLALLRLSLIHI